MSLSNPKQGQAGSEGPSPIRKFFLSPEESRLRAGWRIFGQVLLMLAFLIPLMLLFGGVILIAMLTQSPDLSLDQIQGWDLVLSVFLYLPVILPATWIARRVLDRRSFRSLGFEIETRTLSDLLVGFLIPAGMMGGVFLLQLSLGWIRIDGFLWAGLNPGMRLFWIVIYLISFLAVGFYEELLFRGYYLLNLRDGTNLTWAIILTSIAFGFGHIANPNSGPLAALLTAAAGFFLAYAWFQTRSLWLPISLHAGWNFFLGPIFGFPVSGLDTPSLIQHTNSGSPNWLSGGAYGPEGGLITLVGIAIGTLLVWLYTRRREVRG